MKRKDLEAVLDDIAGAVRLREGEPVLFRGGQVVATDSGVSMIVDLPSELDVAVPFMQLRRFIKSVATDEVKMEPDATRLKVVAGRSRVSLALLPSDLLLLMPGEVGSAARITGMDLKRVVDLTAYCADTSRPNLNGALFKGVGGKLVVVATDVRRLVEAKVAMTGELGAVVVPKAGMEAMGGAFHQCPEVVLEHAGNVLVATGGGKKLYVRLLVNDFPGYERLLAMKGGHKVVVDKGELKQGLLSAGVMIGDPPRIAVRVENGKLHVGAVRQDIGEGDSEVAVQYGGEGVTVAMNYNYLLAAVDKCPTPQLVMYLDPARGRPIIMEPVGDGTVRSLIAPMVVD
jgi:DNA polymerase III sliding clamp (beta) subunit (PCNA family)